MLTLQNRSVYLQLSGNLHATLRVCVKKGLYVFYLKACKESITECVLIQFSPITVHSYTYQ